MSTPFEDPDATYLALVNDEGQYSVWPAANDVPAGWRIVLEKSGRQACLDHIEAHWTDMRPVSLRAAMSGQPGE
ncbi:MbtH family protein [Streptomyces sp. SID13666]|uniref:MbtH family protein n=1 Tax=unclassified Streptomyces TaxID=2593676 RepID=UPI0013C24467|nr:MULTISPECIES: MbtH family protein [unclassified Streptomyces]NEA54864.1 MbtH family protein [Streptomyces sp. SID13666]NEA70666.1 MbtH family protein [Streptomyces sp. SID13588]